jgi:RNA polymerase sigma factor for flagellar operon FliA
VDKKIEAAIFRVESNKMEPAEDHEIANELGITLDRYNKTICRVYNNTHLSIDEYLDLKNSNAPTTKTFHEINLGHNPDQTNEIYKKEIKLIVKNATLCLSDREQLIIKLYYYEEGYTMKRIGHIINVTESRVCQINQEIIKKLKHILGKYNEQ